MTKSAAFQGDCQPPLVCWVVFEDDALGRECQLKTILDLLECKPVQMIWCLFSADDIRLSISL